MKPTFPSFVECQAAAEQIVVALEERRRRLDPTGKPWQGYPQPVTEDSSLWSYEFMAKLSSGHWIRLVPTEKGWLAELEIQRDRGRHLYGFDGEGATYLEAISKALQAMYKEEDCWRRLRLGVQRLVFDMEKS